MTINNKDLELAEKTRRALATLTPIKELILRLKFGIGTDYAQSLGNEQIAEQLGISAQEVEEIEAQALRDLRKQDKRVPFDESFSKSFESGLRKQSSIELIETIEQVKKLSPELMRHLQDKTDDLHKLDAYVFEEMVAELLAHQGYDVELVGRNPNTSADIFAVQTFHPSGVKVKVFVEVKRWKDKKVGIEVIDKVIGAITLEKTVFGCNAAMIVSLSGFTKTKKISIKNLELRSLYLKDKQDLLKWLTGYEPHQNGLWLLPGAAESIHK